MYRMHRLRKATGVLLPIPIFNDSKLHWLFTDLNMLASGGLLMGTRFCCHWRWVWVKERSGDWHSKPKEKQPKIAAPYVQDSLQIWICWHLAGCLYWVLGALLSSARSWLDGVCVNKFKSSRSRSRCMQYTKPSCLRHWKISKSLSIANRITNHLYMIAKCLVQRPSAHSVNPGPSFSTVTWCDWIISTGQSTNSSHLGQGLAVCNIPSQVAYALQIWICWHLAGCLYWVLGALLSSARSWLDGVCRVLRSQLASQQIQVI
jgi:hypothetical protein